MTFSYILIHNVIYSEMHKSEVETSIEENKRILRNLVEEEILRILANIQSILVTSRPNNINTLS